MGITRSGVMILDDPDEEVEISINPIKRDVPSGLNRALKMGCYTRVPITEAVDPVAREGRLFSSDIAQQLSHSAELSVGRRR